MAELRLKKGKEVFISRKHPWIFSGALHEPSVKIPDGAIVEVSTADGKFVCIGHFQDASIKVRILSFEKTPIDLAFWISRFKRAVALRKLLGLPSDKTNAYRLINAEGDDLPGLIVDVYSSVAVVQCHSIGMHKVKDMLASALVEVGFTTVYDKSRASLPVQYADAVQDSVLVGELSGNITALENGMKFTIDVEGGQKTGFFLDQRENRELLARYAAGKTVLNTFSYTGGFSVAALRAGAQKVISVDVSAKAIEAANENVAINGSAEKHEGVVADVIPYLRQSQCFDIIVLDPPAYAKSLDKRHNAVQGYKRLNMEGMKKVNPGGLLFTFSCSQVVDRQLFYNTVMAAAIESGRNVKVLYHLSQGPDHPVNIFHPEGNYLKGLVLQVD